MPRIDLAPGADLFQDQVHGPDIMVSQMGRDSQALASVGEDISNMAVTVMKQRKQANDSNYAFTNSMEDERQINSYSLELKKTLPEGAPGYSQKMQEYIQNRMDENISNAPSETAKTMYNAEARRIFTKNTIDADNYENVEQAKKYQSDISDNVDKTAAMYMDNPDPLTFQDTVDSVKRHIQDGVGTNFTPEQARAVSDKAQQQLAFGMMHGYESQERYQEGLEALKPGNPIGDALNNNPKEKAAFLEKFSKLSDAKQVSNASAIHSQLKDMEYVALNGGNVDAGAMAGLIQKLNSNNKIDPDIKARIVDEAKTALVVGQDIQKLKILPRDQWQSLPSAQDENSYSPGVAARGAIKEKFVMQANQLMKEQDKNPVESTLQAFPALQQKELQARGGDPMAVQSYLSDLTSKQQYLQIPNPKIVSNAEAQYLGDMITKAPTPGASAQVITHLQQSYGKYFPQMFNELAEKSKNGGGGINPNLAVVAFMPDQGSRTKIVENVANGKAIISDFTTNHSPAENQILQTEVTKYTTPITNAIDSGASGGENSALAVSIKNQVMLESRKIVNESNGQVSVKDAAKQAYQSIIGNNFTLTTAGKSSVLVPNKIGEIPNNPDLVKGFIVNNSKPDGFKDLNVDVPKSYLKVSQDKVSAQKDYYDVLADTGKWVTNRDHSGIKLVQRTPEGLVSVLDRNGQAIEKKFQDISHDPDTKTVNTTVLLKKGPSAFKF